MTSILFITPTANATTVDHCVSRSEFHKIDNAYLNGNNFSKYELFKAWGASGRKSNVFKFIILRRAYKYHLCGIDGKDAYAFTSFNKKYTRITTLGYTYDIGSLKNWK